MDGRVKALVIIGIVVAYILVAMAVMSAASVVGWRKEARDPKNNARSPSAFVFMTDEDWPIVMGILWPVIVPAVGLALGIKAGIKTMIKWMGA